MIIKLDSIENISSINFNWPKISALLLTYNQEEFVVESLNSILNQELDEPFCIVIHDDASSDSTVEAIYQTINGVEIDIILIVQKENKYQKGINIAAKLIDQIDSKYIAFLEGDDYWTDNQKLCNQNKFLDEHPECGLVHSLTEIVSSGLGSHEDDLMSVQGLNVANLERPSIRDGIELAFGNFIFTPTVMFRKSNLRLEVLRMMDGYSPTDWILWSLCCENSKIGYLKTSSAAYRLHSGNSWAGTDSQKRLVAWINSYWLLAAVLSVNVRFMYQIGLVQLLKGDSQQILNSADLHKINEYQVHLLNWFENVRQTELEKNRLTELHSGFQEAENQLNAVLNSRSWKITLPLRKLQSILYRVQTHLNK